MKKIIYIALCTVIAYGCKSPSAHEGKTDEPFRWSLLGDGTLTISGTGAMPDYGNDDDHAPWYNYRYNITRVNIEKGVRTIGDNAFYRCSQLTSITIPNSVTTIGEDAFALCRSLTSVSIGNSVTTIGSGAFGDCSSLTSITVSSGNTAYASEDGVLFNKSKTEIIRYPRGKAGFNYTIPNSVTTIGYLAFQDCESLRNVVVLRTTPPSMTSGTTTRGNREEFSDDTFYQCPLSSATLTVPYGSKAAYQSASGWKDFGTIVEATP
jgi:hypothetical protein